MSKIANLIKDLQVKQKKIDYLSYIADLLKNDKHCSDFFEVKEEVLGMVDPLLLKLMNSVENDLPTDLIDDFAPDEKQALKEVAKVAAQRLKSGTTASVSQPVNTPFASEASLQKPQVPKKQPISIPDKMQFAMENRHLGNKRVQVENDKNVDIKGEVVGLDSPFVLVKTDSGPTIEVPLGKIHVIS